MLSILLCLKIAHAVQNDKPEFAERLRAEAIKFGGAATYAGSPKRPFEVAQLFEEIKHVWRELDRDLKSEIKSSGTFVEELGETLETIRVLYVGCSPAGADAIRVSGELRAIREALKIGGKGNTVVIDDLPAATIEDLRRALLSAPFEIVHFSGHANKKALVFETADGEATEIPLSAIADLIGRHESVKCVILNACEAAKEIQGPIGPFTVGMEDSIDDDAAIEFSRGFYDALAAGKDVDFAVEEGKNSVELKSLDASPITILK